MVRMTHLIWRNGRAYFRYRLPPALRSIPKPKHWPHALGELVSESKPDHLKHELTKALGTRDERLAKRGVAVELVRVEDLIKQALDFIESGPPKTLSTADVMLMADRFAARLIASDMENRKQGFGLQLPTAGKMLASKLGFPLPKLIDNSEPGLTDHDLDLLRFAVAKVQPEIREALARQRPPEFIKLAASKALDEAGIELERGSPERRDLELAFLASYGKALEAYAARNAGDMVATPVLAEARNRVPTIRKAFEVWKTGSGTRGEPASGNGGCEEASPCGSTV